MNPAPRSSYFCILALAPLTALTALARSVPAPAPVKSGDAAKEDAIVLSPFSVTTSSEQGYAARETLAGSRLKTELKDTPSQISVMIKEFLHDIAAVSIEDSYRYSINVENTGEFQSATSASGDFNNSVINTRSSNRIRGLTAPGVTHDFFKTVLQQDAYNTERVTFSSGPNSILFGNGNPAGIVDTTFAQADLRRARYEPSIRDDSHGSFRVSFDFNQPILRDKIAVRIAHLNSDSHHWRKPGGDVIHRNYATLTAKPFSGTTVRAWYEDAELDKITPRNTLIGDQVTPWIAAGRPIFDNGLATPGANPVATDPIFARNTATKTVFAFGANAGPPLLIWGSAGTGIAAGTRYSVVTKGPGNSPYQSGIDSYLYSLVPANGAVSPRNVSVNGDGTRNWMKGRIGGFSVEQRVGSSFFLDFSYNRENAVNPVSDILRGIESAIKVDANKFLPDRVTPNPNAGRYYVEGSGRVTRFVDQQRERRATISYDADLTKWSRWLGKHRLAGLYQVTDTIANQQGFDARAVPAGVSAAAALDNYGGATYNTVNWRAYLSNPRDPSTGAQYYLNLPFRAFDATTLPDGSTVTSANNPYGGTNGTNISHTRLEGKLFAMQNRILDDRLIATFGWRSDTTRQASFLLGRKTGTSSAFQTFENVGVPSTWNVFTGGNTATAGAVAHVQPWLSFFYNQSNTWNPPRAALGPDGANLPGSVGQGSDYGLMLRFWQDRVSFRLNRYKNTSGPDISDFRTQIIPAVQNIEETLKEAADAGQIARPPATRYDPSVGTFVYDMISDQVAKGYEFELIANPTAHWRLAFNGAKAEAVQSNIGAAWIAFVNQRLPIWTQYANLTGPGTTNTTISSRVTGIVQTLELMKQADGQRSEQGRDWRINLVSRYAFTQEKLKGAFIGGGYRWRSKAVIGYKATTVPNEFAYPGAPAQLTVPSIKSPIQAKATDDLEAFAGYSRKLGARVTWRVQLNVRNLFDDDTLVRQRANTAGQTTIFAAPDPRAYILTNTFVF